MVPDLEPQWFERYGDVYQSGEPSFFVDRADALGSWYEVSLTRIGGKAERKLTCVFKDVTQRKQQEDERDLTARRMHELATALSESDRRKSEFLATLAHELRNPLAPIRNGLELINDFRSEPLEIDRLQAMLTRQVEQMVHLVDDLLDVTRISQGSVVLKLSSVLLSDVVDTAEESIRHLIKESEHTLDIELPKKAISLVIDPVRITQVLTNLLHNAARYTPSGGHIQLKATVDDNDVHISIVDNGDGMDEQELQQIFEMFTQIENSKSSEYGGLGIGLALSRQLVEMHEGSLRAHSKGLGHGSQFEICLPRSLKVPNEVTQKKRRYPTNHKKAKSGF